MNTNAQAINLSRAELLTPIQHLMLMEASRASKGKEWDGLDNPDLEDIIATVRRQSPEKFHTEESLRDRKFVSEPGPKTLNRGFIHHASASVRKGWEAAWSKTRETK